MKKERGPSPPGRVRPQCNRGFLEFSYVWFLSPLNALLPLEGFHSRRQLNGALERVLVIQGFTHPRSTSFSLVNHGDFPTGFPMLSFKPSSVPDQLATYLRTEILERRLRGTMPGAIRLTEELGVHRTTVGEALHQLEREGILVSQGVGRRRLIKIPSGIKGQIKLSIGILLFEPHDRHLPYIIDLRHQLHNAGHSTYFAPKSLFELDQNPDRVASLVKNLEADAWIVMAGSRRVLQWFMRQPTPTFAIFGSMRRLPIAGITPDKTAAFTDIALRLLKLGHRRIVYLTRSERTIDDPGRLLGGFLEKLKTAGIPTGGYNLPSWQKSPAGLRCCLDALFATTPPTALLIDGSKLFAATQQYLSRLGIHAPEHVSLICTDPDPTFEWCWPSIAQVQWSVAPVIRHAVRWVDKVGQGKDDRRKSLFKAHFLDGGTVGPAPQ